MPEFSVFVAGDAPTKPVMSRGRNVTVWSAETPAAGHSSIPVSVGRGDVPTPLSAEIAFTGAPGAFQIDLQTADTPQDKYFVTRGSVTAVNAGYVARIEMTVIANYARLKLISRANSVACTATIS